MDLDMSIQHPVVRDDLEGMEAALASADGPRDGFLQPLELLPEDETPADGAPDSDGLHGTHRGERDPQEAADRERRKRRRAQWEKDQQDKRRWDLQRRLADISTDVELLSREVARVRNELHVPLPSLASLPVYELQTLEAARSRRLTDILNTHCKKTLQAIMAHKWSWPFNTPVDITVYKDYLETVSKPMDFGTVKRQLESGQYTTPDAFLADVRLVFNNAQAYNKPGSDVFVMANTLQEKFEDKYSAAVAPKVTEEATVYAAETLAARRRHAGAAAAAGGPQREAAESRLAFLIRYIDQVGACVADAKSAAAALCAPLTRAEKEQLCSTLGRLPQHHFEAAVGLVLHHHPGLQPFDDVGFDLDMLDSLTLRQLQSFVAAATAAEEEQRRGRAASGGKEETAQVTWPGIPLGAGVKQFVVKRKKASASPVAAPAAEGGAADAATPAARMVTMPPAQSAAPVGSVAPSGAALWSQNGGDGRAAAAEDGKEGRGSPDEEMVDDGEGGGCDDEAEAGSEEEEGGEEDGEEGDDDDDDDEQ